MMINSAIQIKHIIKNPSSALVPLKRKLQSSIHGVSLFSAVKFWHHRINSIFLQITSTELEFQVDNYGIIQLLHWKLILPVSELFLLLLFHFQNNLIFAIRRETTVLKKQTFQQKKHNFALYCFKIGTINFPFKNIY